MGKDSHLFSRATRFLRNPVAADAGLLALSLYIGAAFGLVTAIFAARLLGPRNYGFAVLIMTYPTLVWSLLGVKSMTITMRYLSAYHATNNRDEFLAMCVLGYGVDIVTALGALVFVGGTGWWVSEKLFDLPGATGWTIVYAASFPFVSLGGTSWAILSALGRFRWLAALQVTARATTLAFVLILLLSGLGAAGLVVASLAGDALGGTALFFAAKRAMKKDGFGAWLTIRKELVWPVKREFRSLLGWNYLAVTFGTLVSTVPVLMLGALRGPTDAAFFRLAASVTTVASYVETSLGKVTYPILSTRWAVGERHEVLRTLRRWTLRAGLPTSLVLIAVVPMVPLGVSVVFGEKYGDMTLGLQFMLVGTAVSGLFFAINPFYYAIGQVRFWTMAYGIHAVAVLGVAWTLVNPWGFVGVAASLGLGALLFNAVMAGLAKPMWRRWGSEQSAPEPPPSLGIGAPGTS